MGVGVTVGSVGVGIFVPVGVAVGVGSSVGDGVFVGVTVGRSVIVGVAVGSSVGIGVTVTVGVGVGVGIGSSVSTFVNVIDIGAVGADSLPTRIMPNEYVEPECIVVPLVNVNNVEESPCVALLIFQILSTDTSSENSTSSVQEVTLYAEVLVTVYCP